MDRLEQKLKAYYEHNADYDPSDAFMRRMMTLEAHPAAAKRSRRRYAVAAAFIALAVALGSGWAILRAARPAETPEPDIALSTPAGNEITQQEDPPAPHEPRKKQPAAVSPQDPEEPAEPVVIQIEPARYTAEPAPEAPVETAPVTAEEPAPEPPSEPEPTTPEPPEPPESIEPDPQAPVEADPPEDTDPPAADPTPEDPLPAEDHPDTNEPEIIHLEDHGIDASYQTEDGIETLTLMSAGTKVVLDVTGWQEELSETPLSPEEPEEPFAAAASTYSGHSSVIDVIFDKTIVFNLILDEDGTVRVVLDVTDTGN